jgi:hypothetical protein
VLLHCIIRVKIFFFCFPFQSCHLCRKTTVLSCHRCLINTGVKNEQDLNIDQNFDHKMSLGQSKCWYSNNCLHFFKACSSIELFPSLCLSYFDFFSGCRKILWEYHSVITVSGIMYMCFPQLFM